MSGERVIWVEGAEGTNEGEVNGEGVIKIEDVEGVEQEKVNGEESS